MDSEQARARLTRIFSDLTDPAVPAAEVVAHFSPDYRQSVDGRLLDREGFARHVAALKADLSQGVVHFERVVAAGQQAASVHRAEVWRRDGRRARLKVVAFFEFEHAGPDARVRRVEELTHLLEGDASDRDLGSRTQ